MSNLAAKKKMSHRKARIENRSVWQVSTGFGLQELTMPSLDQVKRACAPKPLTFVEVAFYCNLSVFLSCEFDI